MNYRDQNVVPQLLEDTGNTEEFFSKIDYYAVDGANTNSWNGNTANSANEHEVRKLESTIDSRSLGGHEYAQSNGLLQDNAPVKHKDASQSTYDVANKDMTHLGADNHDTRADQRKESKDNIGIANTETKITAPAQGSMMSDLIHEDPKMVRKCVHATIYSRSEEIGCNVELHGPLCEGLY